MTCVLLYCFVLVDTITFCCILLCYIVLQLITFRCILLPCIVFSWQKCENFSLPLQLNVTSNPDLGLFTLSHTTVPIGLQSDMHFHLIHFHPKKRSDHLEV